MAKYDVKGMTCAACQAHVERAVKGVEGVTQCSVNLLTNSMVVEGTASPDTIISAVEKAGYGASLQGEKTVERTKDENTKKLLIRLFLSIALELVLMYFSMGHTMLKWPVGDFFENNHTALGIIEMLLALSVMIIDSHLFKSGIKSAIHLSPNMDTLVALGSGASFIYSVALLFLLSQAEINGNQEMAMSYFHGLHFETAAMIPTLISIGKVLESKSKGKTTNALKELMSLAPQKALVRRDGTEIEIDSKDLQVGDIFLLKAGSSVPVDGVILSGSGSFDESTLTGESIPVDKEAKGNVFSGTVLTSGYVECEAKKVGQDTTLSKIIQMVSDANAGKAPISKVADRVSFIFVPAILVIAIIVLTGWLIHGGIVGSPSSEMSFIGFALARGISVLVVACPCALGLATPVAIMVASGKGAKNGILFKTAEAMEETGKCEIVVFDKTGTITKGIPTVTFFKPFIDDGTLLSVAYTLEKQSQHPLAKAIVNYAEENQIAEVELGEYKTIVGNGLSGSFLGAHYAIGNIAFIGGECRVPDTVQKEVETLSGQGETCVFLEKDGVLAGIFAISDVVRDDAKQAIEELKKQGVHPVMLTGDNKKTAGAIAKQVGIEEIYAEVLPQDKEAVIRQMQQKGKVMMVGDGVNDAPALSRADIGIGMSSGTDVAIESADVVVARPTLTSIPAAIRLSRRALLNIKENLFWAFFYNSICIPIAAGAFYYWWGWAMNPMIGAAAMSVSSITVVLNALRLNLFHVYNGEHDRPLHRKKKKGDRTMEKVILVKGMMCAHCEAHVKAALEKVDGVVSASASKDKGEAVVTLSKDVPFEELKKAIEAADYEVLGEKK